jgi:hypothetical protein
MPSTVDNFTAVLFALLECHLRLPLWDVDGVNITSWFDAESCARASSWKTLHCGHIDMFAGIELERGFCAGYLQVNLAFWVVERS